MFAPIPSSLEWHPQFLALLPAIRRHARLKLLDLPGESREDAVAEVIASACAAYARLAEQGRAAAANGRSLAGYGVKHYFAGRRVGTPSNVRDVCSPYCHAQKGVTVGRLDQYDAADGCWREVLVEDGSATPADLAASRIDFPAWLRTLSRRDRRIALTLARGEQTGQVSRMFQLSAARISQLRRELQESWFRFHGEEPEGGSVLAVA